MKEILIKNKKTLIIMLILISVGLSIFFVLRYISKNNKINEVNNNNYSFQYDDTWEIDKEDELELSLIHKKSKSKLEIKINELEDEIQYKGLDEIFDSVLYNIQDQNKNYKLLYKEQSKITKQNIDGYKILFETDQTQAVICLYKQGNKLVTFIYEAEFEYFDILLDSVNNIIYNFNINETKFDVKANINLETKKINYTEQTDISNLLNDTIEDEIATSNYLVKYSIPSNFKATSYDSRYGYYDFQDLSNGNRLKLSTSILKKNIYEYLDKEDSNSLYSSYNLNSYNKENEVLDKFGENPLSYIYKNNYLTNNKITENIAIVFELNKNHIFIVKISSEGVGIPEEVVKMIKMNNSKNISSNITIEKEDGFLIGKLKQYADYSYKQTEEITLKLPDSYQEIDKEGNLYKERNYISKYDEKRQFAEYEVQYKLISSIDSELKILNDSVKKDLGQYKEILKIDDIRENDKEFKAYEQAYTQQSSATDSSGQKYKYYTNEKVLFYEWKNGKYLAIIIKANDNIITDELIKQLTNFDINIK